MNQAILFFATGAYLSYLPGWMWSKVGRVQKRGGEGFLGSLEGLLVSLLMPKNAKIFLMTIILGSLAAFWLCGKAEKILGRHDDGRIILDEILGMMCAAFLLPHTVKAYLLAFLLFRIFDMFKVFPCNWFEKLPGGYGVVADDLCAGVMANLAAHLVL